MRNRRQFMQQIVGAAGLLPALLQVSRTAYAAASPFKTRGVVLTVEDLETLDWPRRAAEAGLTTIGTHITPSQVARFVESEKGQAFLDECRALGLEVEHELHAMSDLLPRDLFDKAPEMFRMDERGNRVKNANCCVHSQDALDVIGENIERYAGLLKPTTGRYFYWIDDAMPMCRCPKCRVYSDADQALLLENEMLRLLRRLDERASLAHLAYANTLEPPTQVKPEPGIFLEFAPIHRTWERPLRDRAAHGKVAHGRYLDALDANLAVFDKDSAQALEYWLDVSLFSKWKRDRKVKLPWRKEVVLADLKTYFDRGIRHITTFAVYIDGDYITQFGEPPTEEYGACFAECLA